MCGARAQRSAQEIRLGPVELGEKLTEEDARAGAVEPLDGVDHHLRVQVVGRGDKDDAGRLELFTILVLFHPMFWRR